MKPLHPYAISAELEARQQVDGLVRQLDRLVPDVLRRHPWRSRLAGTWLGHALHPLLTDVALGFWTSATVLDLIGGRRSLGPSTVLTGLGVAAAVPTAVSGVVEWLDTEGGARRVGAVHATVNVTASAFYTASFVAKLRRRRGLGVATSVVGGLAGVVGGYLGAHLSFARGVGVDRTVQQREQDGWTTLEVLSSGEEVVSARASSGDRFLLLADARAGRIAVPDRCTRCGRRLRPTDDHLVTCVRDGSSFAPTRGAVVRGPATTPLPVLEVAAGGDRPQIRHRR